MPFTERTAPPDVKERYSGRCLEVWVQVFNDTLSKHDDEGRAFATAEQAGQNCKAAKTEETRMNLLAVKFEGDSDTIIRGLAFPFTKDLSKESFGPDTDVCEEWFPDGRPMLYHHGLNGQIKTAVVARQKEIEDPTEEGRWIKGELDKRSAYYGRVKQLIDRGALSLSTGAMPHLVEVDADGKIKRWPWVETSFTPTPAHPGAQVTYAVKSDMASFMSDLEGSGSESFDDHTSRVVTDVAELLARAEKRIDLRATKAGRELSASNREMLSKLLDELHNVEQFREQARQLLNRTDPEAKKAVDSLEGELLVTELRIAGFNI